ncbi:MAG: DUF4358 domain-containing protein [Clostridia bacterium]|nr:DUF4358 domain-containing protein [Clostridia bacterium]
MKHLRRILILSLAVLTVLSLFSACGEKLRDDLTSEQIMEKVLAAIPTEKGYIKEESFLESDWGENAQTLLDGVSDRHIVISGDSANNVDEVGIFHVKDSAKTEELRAIVQTYVDGRVLRFRDLLAGYNPQELPKLDEAKVEVRGNYIYYSILSEDATAKALTAFENALKAD